MPSENIQYEKIKIFENLNQFYINLNALHDLNCIYV